MTLEDLRQALANVNVQAFLRVIREGESGQDNLAYRVINGGDHFPAPPWQHPWPDGTPTTQGGKAAGAYQFLPSTWKRVADALDLPDFSPDSQDLGAVYLIAGRGALQDVIAGNLVAAISKLRDEWVSLPAMGLKRAQDTFIGYGGSYTPQAPTQAPTAPPMQPQAPVTQPEKPMPILGLIAAFGPIIAQLIPQIASIMQPKGEVPKRNLELAQLAFDTITQAAGAVNVQEAVTKMQADPAVAATVTQAVLTQPTIMETLTIGPDLDKARAAAKDWQASVANDPWYLIVVKAVFNPVMVVTILTIPLVYIIVLRLVAFMDKVSADVIAQTIGTIIGLVLGGVMGFWMGQTYQQTRQRSNEQQAQQTQG